MLCLAASQLAACGILASVRAEPPAACAVRSYEVITVPLRPAAIDDAGDVAGTTADHRAALWSRSGGLRVIPLPPGFAHSEAVAINRHGEVAGVAYDEAYKAHAAFVYSSHGFRVLGGAQARAFAIGASGQVVGEALTPGSARSEPVIWRAASPMPLGSCCGGSAKAVNASGWVVGDAYDTEGRYHAVLWIDGSPAREIGPKDGYSSAIAVNDRGDILIEALARVYLYDSSGLVRLELAPKGRSHPHAVNNCGVVVGSFGPFSDAARAFVWSRASGFQDLNGRLSGDTEGWKLEAASGINNRGEIVGKGDTRRANDVGFMLIPVP